MKFASSPYNPVSAFDAAALRMIRIKKKAKKAKASAFIKRREAYALEERTAFIKAKAGVPDLTLSFAAL